MDEKHEENLDRVWDTIEKVGVTMLTTHFAGGLRARPLEARPERDAGLIWFVTYVRSGKEHEIEAEPRPTTGATGRTVPARAAAAAPEHRCAAARCQVPRHGPPAARRTPAHKKARALRNPSARPPADRESGAATTGAGGAYGSA